MLYVAFCGSFVLCVASVCALLRVALVVLCVICSVLGLFDALSSVECRVLHTALCVALSVLCYVLSALLICVLRRVFLVCSVSCDLCLSHTL